MGDRDIGVKWLIVKVVKGVGLPTTYPQSHLFPHNPPKPNNKTAASLEPRGLQSGRKAPHTLQNAPGGGIVFGSHIGVDCDAFVLEFAVREAGYGRDGTVPHPHPPPTPPKPILTNP